MTFEEWLPTFSSDNYITTADIKEIWNAAIESAIMHLKKDDYYWPDDGEGFMTRPKDKASSPEVELRKLLTA